MNRNTAIELSFYERHRLTIHVVAWSAYFLLWFIVGGELTIHNFLINSIFLIAQMGMVYSCTAWLMPKLLYKKRLISFIVLLILSFFFFSALLYFGLFLYQQATGIEMGKFFVFPNYMGPTLGSVSTSLTIGLVSKLVKDNLLNQRRAQNLEKENLQQEIKFLKSQLDPHFLFNALNNIYWQIKKDPNAAADSLAKFSDMLRYQMYDCNTEKISLQQEVDYLINYIDVAKLGYDEEVEVRLNISEQINGQMISPLLLIPFAENAIKHLGTVKDECYIDIDLNVQNDSLVYAVKNSKDQESPSTEELRSSGIGLSNVQRRLNLLYPEKHNLSIKDAADNYEAKLELDL